jgi:hypothetical protein
MTPGQELIRQLRDCPRGAAGWMEYEQTGLAIGTYLFVPPLGPPVVPPRTRSGTERRDAVFPNWNFDLTTPWGMLRQDLRARMVVFEFKNYAERAVGKDEVNQVRGYLTEPMGGLGILCCRERPNQGARIKRNTIYSEEKKVILFVTDDDFMKMLEMKEQGGDPAQWILHLVAEFSVEYE